MFRNSIETGLIRRLTQRASHPAFPVFVGGIALASTLSMSVPFASLLVATTLMAPRRWLSIAVWSSLGAAVGAGLLYLAFHHLGWVRLFALYPEIVRTAAWSDATRWLSNYGVAVLLLIAALPLPLTPALMFAAITGLSVIEVLPALWLGKLIKYTTYAWLTSAFPTFNIQRIHRRVEAIRSLLSHASAVRKMDER